MGPRVKFSVDPTASETLDKQLISNDLAGRERVHYMVFKLGNESWDLITQGTRKAGWWEAIVKECPKNSGRQIIFRSEDDKTDVWIKYIPDDAPIKEKTHYATASDSLFDDTRGCKNKIEIRDLDDLKASNPQISKFLQ